MNKVQAKRALCLLIAQTIEEWQAAGVGLDIAEGDEDDEERIRQMWEELAAEFWRRARKSE
jgi:hypothetical protein